MIKVSQGRGAYHHKGADLEDLDIQFVDVFMAQSGLLRLLRDQSGEAVDRRLVHHLVGLARLERADQERVDEDLAGVDLDLLGHVVQLDEL